MRNVNRASDPARGKTYLLATAFWHTDEHEDILRALGDVHLEDEIVFNGLSDAYHRDIRLILAAQRGEPPPPVSSVVLLDLATPGFEIPKEILNVRTYLPSAVFVLWCSHDEYNRATQEMPPEWTSRLTHFYRLLKTPKETLNQRLRTVLDPAKHRAQEKSRLRAEGKPGVFVSYSRRDSVFADQLVFRLKADGFPVWLDRSRLHGGELWQRELEIALREAAILILVTSPDALASEYTRMEYQYFLSEKKPVIPVIAQKAERLPDELASIQFVDFTQADFEFAYMRLFTAIQKCSAEQLETLGAEQKEALDGE
jgi:hypothetical protein